MELDMRLGGSEANCSKHYQVTVNAVSIIRLL
jgi:hypothetical protein